MKRKKILLVEDDEEIREALSEALEFAGYDVITAFNGKNALDTLIELSKEKRPNLILLDFMMPVMDGPSFMKTIEIDYKAIFGQIPIILISALSNPVLTGCKAPAAFFKKPMILDELFSKIQTLVK
ncbi:MAG TPA: response regulator [Bacteriovoracaceae bacterium]|nr:response regulator [Bacteriovoracaceae bacterium]